MEWYFDVDNIVTGGREKMEEGGGGAAVLNESYVHI